jgi:hypothetical protein
MGMSSADELAKRLTTMLPVTIGVTTAGDISISCGDGTAGDKNAFMAFTNFPTPLSTNIVGLAADVYTPTVIQLVTEHNPTAGAGADILGPFELANLLTVLVNTDARIDWYQSANGTAPVFAGITGTPAASVYGSLYGGMR